MSNQQQQEGPGGNSANNMNTCNTTVNMDNGNNTIGTATRNSNRLISSNSEDSYFGRFSNYFKDDSNFGSTGNTTTSTGSTGNSNVYGYSYYYGYARDSITQRAKAASDEASRQFSYFTDGVRNTFVGGDKGDITTGSSTGTSTIINTGTGNNLSVSNHNSNNNRNTFSSISAKKGSSWLMRRSVYDSVTGRSSALYRQPPLPNNSVTAVRNLVQLVTVDNLQTADEIINSRTSGTTASTYHHVPIETAVPVMNHNHRFTPSSIESVSSNNIGSNNDSRMNILYDTSSNDDSSVSEKQETGTTASTVIASNINNNDIVTITSVATSGSDDHNDKSVNEHHFNNISSNDASSLPSTNSFASSNILSPIPTTFHNDNYGYTATTTTNYPSVEHTPTMSTFTSQQQLKQQYSKKKKEISNEETASRLGEGTIRALRDIVLDEALELHHSLRFWTERWERPILFYIEFAPRLLMAKKTKDNKEGHFIAGQRVSQLQAILARRCSSIGELQLHLWRAGWQSGVAQWGILGQGSEFAPVIGGNGRSDSEGQSQYNNFDGFEDEQYHSSSLNSSINSNAFFSVLQRDQIIKGKDQGRKKRGTTGSDYYVDSLLYVRKQKGGAIMKNDSALAAWSIDAIRLVRYQLYNAGNGMDPLPCYENWPTEQAHFLKKKNSYYYHSSSSYHKRERNLADSMISIDEEHLFEKEINNDHDLPIWAAIDMEHENIADAESLSMNQSLSETLEGTFISTPGGDISLNNPSTTNNNNNNNSEIKVIDIQKMAEEVNGILNSMETYMSRQRLRRLLKLKPPSRISRNWYIAAIVIPVSGYAVYKLAKGHIRISGTGIAADVYSKLSTFFNEHMYEPLLSIYRELFTRKGREEITDRKARQEVIASLKTMIKNYLDDTHPEMSEQARTEMANAMDMSLLEATKEQLTTNILEINSIYRLSLIEMQFIKKEMMNALYAMDELMGSNEINMRLTSMTPAFLLVSSCRYVIKKLYYALFKLGKSKEEVYASFRHIILDIERLLVMRDNPPISPPPLPSGIGSHRIQTTTTTYNSNNITSPAKSQDGLNSSLSSQYHENILSADDLGMLMLLVHECRIILYQDRRRFTRQELRNVSEDLSELAGERGAVSVQQQLRIVARMCRTYSFLKVVSSGIPFSVDDSFL